jgi:hypothetical protein
VIGVTNNVSIKPPSKQSMAASNSAANNGSVLDNLAAHKHNGSASTEINSSQQKKKPIENSNSQCQSCCSIFWKL